MFHKEFTKSRGLFNGDVRFGNVWSKFMLNSRFKADDDSNDAIDIVIKDCIVIAAVFCSLDDLQVFIYFFYVYQI